MAYFPLKQSFCLPTFRAKDEPVEPLLKLAREIGYAGVEIWNRPGDFDRVVVASREAGLTLCSMCGFAMPGGRGANDPAEHARILGELRESIYIASTHGIPGLICFSGNRRSGQSDADGLAACADLFKRAAELAERAGVTLNIEVLNSRVDHKGYQCDRVDWAVELCERVASPRFKLLFDVYHVQIMEGDVIRRFTNAAKHIGHVHTAGVPGRHELDDDQELNYRAIARAIAASGYEGYVGHEFWPRGNRDAALRQAFAGCSVKS